MRVRNHPLDPMAPPLKQHEFVGAGLPAIAASIAGKPAPTKGSYAVVKGRLAPNVARYAFDNQPGLHTHSMKFFAKQP